MTLSVRRDRRARRIALRLDQSRGEVHLVLPRTAPLAEGLDFAQRKAGWILARLDAVPPRIPFNEGAIIPVLGRQHVIARDCSARRGVWREDGVLRVSGFPEHLSRRVADYLKEEARRELSARSHAKAAAVGRRVLRVALKDTRSRWGSCSAAGALNYSWRLILAPEPVLDYVVAHEVAHLVHMDHSRRFWALVRKLTPEVAAPQTWLRANGGQLLRYG